MTNHPNRKLHAAIRAHIRDMNNVERVKHVASDDTWHAYGRMPNSIETGWWFVGFTGELSRRIDAK